MTPALRGRFLTTEPSGKPFLIVSCEFSDRVCLIDLLLTTKQEDIMEGMED